MTSDTERRLAVSLLLLGLSLGLVMLVWAFDKILNPSHGAAVFKAFYGLSRLGESVITAIGVVQVLIVAAFLFGLAQTWSYGALLLMHAVTTLVSWNAYLQPLKNILFSPHGRCSQGLLRFSCCGSRIGLPLSAGGKAKP
jgi:hypothetical protein